MRYMAVFVLLIFLVIAMAAAAPGQDGDRPSPPTADAPSTTDDQTPSHATRFARIEPGDVVNVSIARSQDIGVSRITVSVVNPARNVKITVTRQDGKPADVPAVPGGTAYRYLNITASNLSDDDIAASTVIFSVNQSWLVAHNATAERVQLARHTADGWTPLPTTVQNKSDANVTYVAESPGFSIFSIFARDDEPAETVCGNGICQANQTWESCPSDCEKPQRVVNAEQAIGRAADRIASGEDGYSTLQNARAAYDAGNYSDAAVLARQAIREHRTADRHIIRFLIPILLPLALFLVVIFWKRDTLYRYLSQDTDDRPE